MRKFINLFLLIGLFLFNNLGFAMQQQCPDLSGTWNGKGTIKWYFLTCEYDSVARVGSGNPALVQVSVTKSKGSFICPKKADQNTSLYCLNNRLEMKDVNIDVVGTLSDDGLSSKLEGNIKVLFMYHPFTLTVNKTQ